MTNLLTIFDIDGTLANCAHRMHHIRPDPSHDPVTGRKVQKRFDRFHRDCVYDTPIPAVVEIYKRFVADPDVAVILLTGRPFSARQDTEDWFAKQGLLGYDQLYTKFDGQDFMPDKEQKPMVADMVEAQYGRKIDMVFEDRQRVVAMWKARGTFVLDVLQHEDD